MTHEQINKLQAVLSKYREIEQTTKELTDELYREDDTEYLYDNVTTFSVVHNMHCTARYNRKHVERMVEYMTKTTEGAL